MPAFYTRFVNDMKGQSSFQYGAQMYTKMIESVLPVMR